MDRRIVKLLGLVALAACDSDVEPDPIDCVPLPPNALHWWTGDGDGTDRVGTAHATLMHGVEFAPGLVESGGGQAFSFDGIDAYGHVDDTPTLNPTGPFSIVVWAKPGPNPWSGSITGKGHTWQESWVSPQRILDRVHPFRGRWGCEGLRSQGGPRCLDPSCDEMGRQRDLAICRRRSVGSDPGQYDSSNRRVRRDRRAE